MWLENWSRLVLITPASVVRNGIRGIQAVAIVAAGLFFMGVGLFGRPSSLNHSSDSSPQTGRTQAGSLQPAENETSSQHALKIPYRLIAIASGVALLSWSAVGRLFHPKRLSLTRSPPIPDVAEGIVRRIPQPDGAEIHMETRTMSSGPTVVLTHGWSLNRHEWDLLQYEWGQRFQVVVWDIPGMGKSKSPDNHDFSLENMARQLKSVIDATESTKLILVGHSIGGMILLTFCRLFPELLEDRISRLALVHTTYINPLHSMASSGLYTRLQKPLIEPMLHLQIWSWPVVWCLTWMCYWNGSLHRAAAETGFSPQAPRSKLDYAASFYPRCSPAVLARGALAMLKLDEERTLPQIPIPVLVVAGTEDPITELWASREMQRRIPNAQIHVYEPGKHFGFMEYSSEFAQLLADFCEAK